MKVGRYVIPNPKYDPRVRFSPIMVPMENLGQPEELEILFFEYGDGKYQAEKKARGEIKVSEVTELSAGARLLQELEIDTRDLRGLISLVKYTEKMKKAIETAEINHEQAKVREQKAWKDFLQKVGYQER